MELLNTSSYFNQLVGEKMAGGGLLPLLYFVLKSSAPLCGDSSAFCFFEGGLIVVHWNNGWLNFVAVDMIHEMYLPVLGGYLFQGQ
jgi:hypothetical protein